MNTQSLPKRLNKEPLIDVIFEIRFSSSIEASSVLPGLFFSKLKAENWRIEHLPFSEIPSQIRSIDHNLRYQPLMRIHWDNFFILIGDTMLGIACKIPYPGWTKFKERIINAIKILADTGIVQAVERYSIKYVDVIEGENLAEQIQRLNIDIRIGKHTVKEEKFTVRIEIPSDNFMNIVQIAASAVINTADGKIRKGVLVDTDSICSYRTDNFKEFVETLPGRLEAIHDENKKMFFECLSQEAIMYLEPVYE